METVDRDPCGGPQPPQRNHYFAGKLLSEQDFQAEQTYLIRKHTQHARYLHGYGVVCGLRVRPAAPPQPRRVLVEPGLALDRCGREIVVPQPVEFQLRTPSQHGPVYLVIEYSEEGTDTIPVPGPPDGPQDMVEPSRIIEAFRFSLRHEPPGREDDLSWQLAAGLADAIRNGAEPETLHNLLAEFVSRPCRKGRSDLSVTLARIDVPAEGPIAEAAIDNYSYRPVVLSVGQALNLMLSTVAHLRG